MYLLKREGVDEKSTWDQTMRKIVLDPLYKALNTLAEKREAFEKVSLPRFYWLTVQYTRNIVANREAAKTARIDRLRPIFHKMFAASPDIKTYSTIKTADRVFARDRNWREAEPNERRLILEEYTTDRLRREEAAARDLRTRNIAHLGTLIRTLDITAATPWRAAHNIITSSEAFRSDKDFQQIEVIDILSVYDDYSRQLEKEYDDDSRRLRIDHVRKGRRARDGFKVLLGELQARGDLTRKSKWKETLAKIKDDERYLALLGLQGSSPLDLWMDAVDDLGEETDRAAEKIEKAFKDGGEVVDAQTTWERFEEMIREVHADLHIEGKLRRDAYDLVSEFGKQLR